jgi:hypothetical protein
MTNTTYTPIQRSANTLAVAKHYEKNKFEIQRKRKLKNILDGMKVRSETIIKCGLEKEAKAQGLEVKESRKGQPCKIIANW